MAAILAIDWPRDYAEFMAKQDGGEGMVGESFVHLWAAADLLDMNRGFGLTEFAPDLIGFGSDGGGECFAFDRRTSPAMIVMVPFIGLDQPKPQGVSLLELLERLRDARLFVDDTG